ncbi:MAG: hypothetical protein AB8C46_22815 [Burkholderiaceae bacterium]
MNKQTGHDTKRTESLSPSGHSSPASPGGPASVPDNPEPEQTYFADPATDRLFGVLLNLSTEVFVLREQCAAMQRQLEQSGALDAALMRAAPSNEEAAESAASQQAFVTQLLEPLLGSQLTRGTPSRGQK